MQSQKKINVYILTGFLGSGKTTVLNQILSHFSKQKSVVIENEFGKINIDSTLLNGAFENVFELTNGCICCSINNQLLETLTRIHTLDNRPDNLFIETTGIADAGEIAANFTSAYVAEAFDLKKIITVVDAENVLFYKDSNIEVEKQIVAADRVVVNKYELVNAKTIAEIKDYIQSINPYTSIELSKDGSIDPIIFSQENKQTSSTPIILYKSENGHKIKTILYETDDFFDIENLKYLLFKNLYLYYHQIYRIKGYVRNTKGEVFLVQTTGKSVVINSAENSKITKNQLVFIGKELKLNSIERLFKSAVIKNNKTQ